MRTARHVSRVPLVGTIGYVQFAPGPPEPTYPQRFRRASLELARGAPVIPGDWTVLRDELLLGVGESTFIAASSRLRTWEAHRYAGLRVDEPEPVPGLLVSPQLRVLTLELTAPCLVIEVVDEPREYAFVYGTVPGHPEQGEQTFRVWLREDGLVKGCVASFSRGALPLTRLAAPISQRLQQLIARRYLKGMRPLL